MSDRVPPAEFVDLALRLADAIDRSHAALVELETQEQKLLCDSGKCSCAYHVYFMPTQVSVGMWL